MIGKNIGINKKYRYSRTVRFRYMGLYVRKIKRFCGSREELAVLALQAIKILRLRESAYEKEADSPV